MKTNDVIALGNTLMDLLVEVNDNTLMELNLTKGEMHLVDEEKSKELLNTIKSHQMDVEIVPGGSAANTLRALALLGANVILCGKVGQDGPGEMYVEEIKNHGVTSRINNHIKSTGHAVTFITPDSERTFSTHLGAAVELHNDDVLEEDVAKSKVLHLEGYQLEGQTRDVVMHAAAMAKKHGTKISLDLSDGALIIRNKEFLQMFVSEYVDIIFANEREAEDFTGAMEVQAAEILGQTCEIAIVKVGEMGSFIHHNGKTIKVAAYSANAIDTTGAGDTYSAGFLYGYCSGWDLEQAGKLGSLFASKIVEKKGMHLQNIDVQNIKKEIEQTLKVGIIGGSGLDNPDILQESFDLEIDTPYGSVQLKMGKINGTEVALLARHGREHKVPPTQVNNRANIHALKEVGCTQIIATTAVGSLREQIGRGDFVVLDQFIDFTRFRNVTFHDSFEASKPIHCPMADPFSSELRKVLNESCSELGLKHFPTGTVVTIEGPRFSTKAESNMFRAWGADVINMSIAPECALANEAGIPYAAVAMSTDYDCWKIDEEPVTWEAVLATFSENVDKVTKLLVHVVGKL